MKISLCILLVACLFSVQGQSFGKLSPYEKRWALFHPFAALKVRKHLPAARQVYREVKDSLLLDAYESGGRLDAFRHTYVMAYLAQHVPVRKLRKLGRAHEQGNRRDFRLGKTEFGERADSLACQMDLQNNEVGFATGYANKQLSAQELKYLVIAGIKAGKSYYLLRDQAGNYLRCDHTPIHLPDYQGLWYIPKCLVPSNAP